MKKKLFLLITGFSIIFLSVFYSCSGKSRDEIRVGVVAPITGEAATFGFSTKEGIMLSAGIRNARGGISGKKINLIITDDKGDPNEAVTAYAKLIDFDRVVAILGTVMSKCSLAGAPLAQAAKIPMISPASTNPKVTEAGDYIFRACFIDSFQGRIAAKYSYNELKLKKAGIIYDIGNDYSKGLAEVFRDNFIKLGGKIIAYEGHPSGTADFKAQLTKIISSGARVIYVPDYYNDVGLITRQARELGYNGIFGGGDGWDSTKLFELGKEAVEGSFFTNHFTRDDKNPKVQKFVSEYVKEFKHDPDALAYLGYEAAEILFEAINRAGTTESEKLKEALKKTDLLLPSGRIRFDDSRNPVKTGVIIELRGGKQVYKTTVIPE